MNPKATSRETLLEASLSLAKEHGFSALNMRRIAELSGVSVGCVYRYFPSKAELMAATVEKVWESIFHKAAPCEAPGDFLSCVSWLFACIKDGSAEYPAFFSIHSAGFQKEDLPEGRKVMAQYLGHIRGGMRAALEADSAVRQGVFNNRFSKDDFFDFVFEYLLLLGTKGAHDCGFLLGLIDKLLY